jgi:hypothetical protein
MVLGRAHYAARTVYRDLYGVALMPVRPIWPIMGCPWPGGDEPGYRARGPGLERAWQQGQADLAALLPDARHVTATESEQFIQLPQPELVIAAVRAVVDAVRDPGTWELATPGASVIPRSAGAPRATI